MDCWPAERTEKCQTVNPQFFPTLTAYISSEKSAQDTLLWDVPLIHSLTLTALTHSLFRWEWMGKKRTEKVECHPATVSKGLNSAHHFLVIPKHFRIAFSPHLLFPPSLSHSLLPFSPFPFIVTMLGDVGREEKCTQQ